MTRWSEARRVFPTDLGQLPDCADPSCDVCNLGPRDDESRAVWVARLKAKFRADPIPMTPQEISAQEQWERRRAALVACPKCGNRRMPNRPCIGCVSRRRRQTGVSA